MFQQQQPQQIETVSTMMRSILRNVFICMLAPCFVLTLRSWKTATGRGRNSKHNVYFNNLQQQYQHTALLDLPPIPNSDSRVVVGKHHENNKMVTTNANTENKKKYQPIQSPPTLWIYAGPSKMHGSILQQAFSELNATTSQILYLGAFRKRDITTSTRDDKGRRRQAEKDQRHYHRHRHPWLQQALFNQSCHRELERCRIRLDPAVSNDYSRLRQTLSRVPCWKPVMQQLQAWRSSGKISNLVAVEPSLSRLQYWEPWYGMPQGAPLDWISLSATLGGRVKVVVGYTPYWKWLPRVEHSGGHSSSPLSSAVLKPNKAKEPFPVHFTDELIQRIQPFVSSVDVLLFGAENNQTSPVDSFCRMIMGSTIASDCPKTVVALGSEQPQQPSSAAFDSELVKSIFVAARQLKMVPDKGGGATSHDDHQQHQSHLQQWHSQIRHFCETVLQNQTLPLTCPTSQEWQALRSLSLDKDKQIVESMKNSNKTMSGGLAPLLFSEPVPTEPPRASPWCTVDAAKLLQTNASAWKHFFATTTSARKQ